MQTQTGELGTISEEEMKTWEKAKDEDRYYNPGRKMVSITSTENTMLESMGKEKRKGWMRNQPCPCGSKKKFKKCCWSKFQ